MEKFRPWLAEFVGTFALIFVGIGAIKTAGHDVLGIALAHGLTIAVFASATMHILGRQLESGGHVRSALRRSHDACEGNSLLERTTAGRLHGCFDLPGPVWSRGGGDGNAPARY